jgi:hypothetical protein
MVFYAMRIYSVFDKSQVTAGLGSILQKHSTNTKESAVDTRIQPS